MVHARESHTYTCRAGNKTREQWSHAHRRPWPSDIFDTRCIGYGRAGYPGGCRRHRRHRRRLRLRRRPRRRTAVVLVAAVVVVVVFVVLDLVLVTVVACNAASELQTVRDTQFGLLEKLDQMKKFRTQSVGISLRYISDTPAQTLRRRLDEKKKKNSPVFRQSSH